MKQINIENPDNYTFKAPELCLRKGCTKVAEWFILIDKEAVVGLCDKCFKKLDD